MNTMFPEVQSVQKLYVESEWRGIHVYEVRCGRLVWTVGRSRYSKIGRGRQQKLHDKFRQLG